MDWADRKNPPIDRLQGPAQVRIVEPGPVRVALENVERNGVAVELTGADVVAVPGPFDLVVANILANTLVELAPALSRQVAPGGALLLSGLLDHQEDEVLAAFLAGGLEPRESRRDGEWLLLALGRGP